MNARKNVEAGARLLDEELGTDWVHEVDLETLDLNSVRYCVLGQLYEHYIDGVRELADSPSGNLELDGPSYGFDYGYSVLDGSGVTGRELTRLWVDLIWERLARDAA